MKKQCFKLLGLLEVRSNLVLLENEVPKAMEGAVKSEIVTGPRSWRADWVSPAHALNFLSKRGMTEGCKQRSTLTRCASWWDNSGYYVPT